MRTYGKSAGQQKLALERIRELFNEAESADKEYADKYVGLARKISMRLKVPIPKELKRRFCKHCYSFFRQGGNVRVRRTPKGIVYTCLECEKQMRFPIR